MGKPTTETYRSPARPKYRYTVRRELAILTGSLIAGISLFIFLFFPNRLEQQAIDAIAAKASTVAEMSTYALAPALDFSNLDEVAEALRPALEQDDVAFAFVTELDGTRLFSFVRQGTAYQKSTSDNRNGQTTDKAFYQVHRPIISNGTMLGMLEIGFSLKHLRQDLNRSRIFIAFISLLVFVCGLIWTVGMSMLITNPIAALVRATDVVSKGDLKHRVTIRARNEIGLLADSFNDMVANLDQANNDLRDSENRFRAVVEHTSDMLLVIDRHGIVTYASPVCTTILGFPAESIMGKPAQLFLHPKDRYHALRAVLRERKDPDKIVNLEARVRHANRSWRIISFRTRNLIDHPGVSGILVNARDVTESKEFEFELMLAKEKAEEMVRLKDPFLTNMSHEIRTPLTAILGFSQVLRSEVGDEYVELVDTIEQSGKRLLNTLNSVLDLAQLEAESVRFSLQLVNVYEEVRTSVQMLKPLTDKAGLSLEVCTFSDHCFANLDQTYLNRIVNNLVGNAIKFTEQGGILVNISSRGPEIAIGVRDTGIGIDETFMPSLFSEFKQESTGLGREYEGNGLGLTITKRLIEQMGGRITVQSIKGVGSSFTVLFPMVVPEEITLSRTDATGRQQKGIAPGRPPVPGARHRHEVLAVEDNSDLRELLARWSKPEYHITTASTREEAHTICGNRRFDIILMDINLQGEFDGIDAMQELRKITSLGNARFVAMTAHALPGDRDRFVRAGFDAYLGKPFDPDQLFSLLDTLVDRKPTSNRVA